LSGKKILLVRNDNIGDLICTTPAIKALRRRYPTSQIDIVVNSYNFSAIYKNPFIDNIFCYTKSKHESSFLRKVKVVIKKAFILLKIKKEKYDLVVVFRSGYSKSAELFSNISNANYRVGVKDLKNNRDNFNIHIKAYTHKHEVEFCFDCLRGFGINYNNDDKTLYYVNDELIKKYSKYKKYVIFHISSRMKDNKFSKENFLKTINVLKYNKVLITAEPSDFDIARWIDKHSKATFVKTSSLTDLGGIIKNVRLLITLDGGVMHLGPAVGTKTIAISGKTNMDKWYPWGYKKLIIKDKSMVANNISYLDVAKAVDLQCQV
jgi:ADP-heptose:LPS heptosyltransferase